MGSERGIEKEGKRDRVSERERERGRGKRNERGRERERPHVIESASHSNTPQIRQTFSTITLSISVKSEG